MKMPEPAQPHNAGRRVPLPHSLPFVRNMKECYVLQDPFSRLGHAIITCIFLHARKATSLPDREALWASVACEMKPVPSVSLPLVSQKGWPGLESEVSDQESTNINHVLHPGLSTSTCTSSPHLNPEGK